MKKLKRLGLYLPCIFLCAGLAQAQSAGIAQQSVKPDATNAQKITFITPYCF